MSPLLRIQGLSYAYEKQTILDGVGFDLDSGEMLVAVGPSGCGKTTLLRLIAGLERPASGTISLQGEVLSATDVFVQPERRAIGMVFQGLSLFPHLTVEGNIGFGLKHLNKEERRERIEQELSSVGLQGMEKRFPDQLSGGQQQRVAIARALVRRPALILMDEPFSDLDHGTRHAVRTEVLRILRDHGTTAIIVSHDREDAIHMGDRILLMENGRIVRSATPEEMRDEWQSTTKGS